MLDICCTTTISNSFHVILCGIVLYLRVFCFIISEHYGGRSDDASCYVAVQLPPNTNPTVFQQGYISKEELCVKRASAVETSDTTHRKYDECI